MKKPSLKSMPQQIYKSICSFLKEQIDSSIIVLQANQNRTIVPPNKDCCIIHLLNIRRVGTNIHDYDSDSNNTIYELLESDLQLDFYGNNCYEYAIRSQILLEDDIDINDIGSGNYGITSLYCSEIRNLTGLTIVNEQYVTRYSFDLTINFYGEVNNKNRDGFNSVKLNIENINND